MKISGFSLVELMVVIAIVAIISAIAVPAYKNYVLRAKVAASLPVLQSFAAKVIETRTLKGNYGGTVDYGGVTWFHATDNPTNNVLNAPPVVRMNTYFYGDAFNTNKDHSIVCAALTGLDGIDPGYTAPVTPLSGLKNKICMYVIIQSDGTAQTYCGTPNNGIHYIPAPYLPESCQNTDLSMCYGNDGVGEYCH